jgi:hypothetical protein
MPAIVVPKSAIATGPGYVYLAPLGTSLPANTVVGSVFTDTWASAGAWFVVGVTKSGSEFDYKIGTSPIVAAEYFDPLQIVTTDRAASYIFELMQISATGLKNALNGGSLSTSGAGTTLLSSYTPPVPGSEVRTMLGWESQSNDERLVFEQCFQVGELKIVRDKGASNATMPLEFDAELPASGFPFRYWTAGTVRS